MNFKPKKKTVKDLTYEILLKADRPLLEGQIVYILNEDYGRMASGSSISRYLRWLSEEGKVMGVRKEGKI